MTPKEAAQALGIPARTYREWRQKGLIVMRSDGQIDVAGTRLTADAMLSTRGRASPTSSTADLDTRKEKLELEVEKLLIANERAKIRLDADRADVIPRAEAKRILYAVVGAFKSRAESAPAAWAERLARVGTDPDNMRLELEALFRALLESCASETDPDTAL